MHFRLVTVPISLYKILSGCHASRFISNLKRRHDLYSFPSYKLIVQPLLSFPLSL